jgi:DNA-binding Xre family transcriptional regulator
MSSKSAADRVVAIAQFLVEEAKQKAMTASELSEEAGLDKSYLSKAKTGKIKQIPLETLASLARILGRTAESIYRDLNLSLPAAINQRQREEAAIGFEDSEMMQEIQLRSVNSIPDHSWPLVACARGLFQDAGLEADIALTPLSRYPDDYNEVCDGRATTAFVASLQALEGFVQKKFTAVALTHTYKGYAAIARAGASIGFLNDAAGLGDLRALVAKLVTDEVIPKRGASHQYLALLDQPARDFINVILMMATEKHDPLFSEHFDLDGLKPSPSGKTGLEALNRIGPSGRDLAVGHVLSLASAFSDPTQYRIAIDYDHVETAAQELDEKLNGTTPSWRERVQRLRLPVAFVFNADNLDFTGDLTQKSHSNEILALRLASVAYHASATLFTSVTESTVRELLRRIDLPSDHRIGVEHLLHSWQKAYQFHTIDHAADLVEKRLAELGSSDSRMHAILRGIQAVSNRLQVEKKRARELIEQLQTRKLSDTSKQLLELAQRQFRSLNFYDASRIATHAAKT